VPHLKRAEADADERRRASPIQLCHCCALVPGRRDDKDQGFKVFRGSTTRGKEPDQTRHHIKNELFQKQSFFGQGSQYLCTNACRTESHSRGGAFDDLLRQSARSMTSAQTAILESPPVFQKAVLSKIDPPKFP